MSGLMQVINQPTFETCGRWQCKGHH